MLKTQLISMKILLIITVIGFSSALYAKNITGAVYTATNHAQENSIIAYQQFDDGTLNKIGEYKTGGKGTGFIELSGMPYDPGAGHPGSDGFDPLESTYALWRTPDSKNILVANAGNGTVSSLRVNKDFSLSLNNVVDTGDTKPLAIATHGKLVYVASLTSFNKGNLRGYFIDAKGILTSIPYSKKYLKGRPSSIEFTPDGQFLVAVEVITGAIHSYKVSDDGTLLRISTIQSPVAGKGRFLPIPIGTKIVSKNGKNYLLVTEARLVDARGNFKSSTDENKKKYPFQSRYEGQTGSVTSYEINQYGELLIISPDVMAGKSIWDGQQTTCWITASKNGRYAWATNPFTSSISSFNINKQGKLELSEEIAYQAPNYDEYFTDIDLSADGDYVNILSGNTGTVWVYAINHKTGSLELVSYYDGGAKVHSYGIVTISR
ncbi:MAG: 6-phosphogluconolactonase [Cocleimonas sp.]|jgi:6-phosphogluconolactonase